MAEGGTQNESIRFSAEFFLNGTDEHLQLPVVRPGKFLKMWRKAATKVAAVTGATMLSDDRLNEYLIKVGKYFGRDASRWTPEGDPLVEIVEENGRRIVRRTATFVGWKLHLKLRNPFYDDRLGAAMQSAGETGEGSEGEEDDEAERGEKTHEGEEGEEETDATAKVKAPTDDIYDYNLEYVDVEDDQMWRAIIMDQPWPPAERRKRYAALLEAKCLTKEPILQLEGLHGLWEFMVNKDYHADLTPDQIRIVVQSVVHDDVHCAIVAAAAVWSLVAVQESRRKATDLKAVELLLQGAKRSLMWEIDEELRHQYQTCIFGALSVMFVDSVCRQRYCEIEPSFQTLFSFCNVHEGAVEHFEADRRSFVARVFCMMAHRDAGIRRAIVQNDCVLKILELTHTEGPGSNHVNLCMMTIIAILVLDEDAMELLRIKKQAPIVFEACVKQLGICVEMLDPESGKTAMGVDRKLIVAMAECSAQGMWGACYECCLPQGGGVRYDFVTLLSDIGNRAMDLIHMGLGKVTRCIGASLANMCFDLDLSHALMAKAADPPPPPPKVPRNRRRSSVTLPPDEPSEEEVQYDENGNVIPPPPPPEPPKLTLRERGGVGFLIRCLQEWKSIPPEEEPHIRVSTCVGLAALAGHDFAAKGDACLVGPHRPGLIKLGAFHSLLQAVHRPLRVNDEQLLQYCQISSSYAVLQLSTMIGKVEPQSLLLLVTLMKENTKNVEMVEYLMAAIWILLRNTDNRHVLMSEMNDIIGDDQEAAEEQGEEEVDYFEGLKDLEKPPGEEGAGEEPTNDEVGLPSAEASGASGEPTRRSKPERESQTGRRRSVAERSSNHAESVGVQIKDAGTVSSVEAHVNDLSRVFQHSELGLSEPLLSDVSDVKRGKLAKKKKHMLPSIVSGKSGRSSFIHTNLDDEENFFDDEEEEEDEWKPPMTPSLARSRTFIKDGLNGNIKTGSEWGLAIIVGVGNNWIEKLLSEGPETVDMDAPLVKLFEFLVSALCLLISQDMGEDGEILEAQDDKLFEKDETGAFWGVKIRPPTPNLDLSPALNGAVDLLVRLMALRSTVAARIVQLGTAALWNICKVDLASQRYMLTQGLAKDLIEIPHCTAFPPLVRANCCMLLAVLAEHIGNIALIPGGLGAVTEVAISSILTKIPVMEQRGSIVLGRLSFRPPQGAPSLRDALNENKERIAKMGGIAALVGMMRHTHMRIINIESKLLSDNGPGKSTARSRAREHLMHVRNKSTQFSEMAHDDSFRSTDTHKKKVLDRPKSTRQMTLIRAIKMRRGEDAVDPFNEFEEDMDTHENAVLNMHGCMAALLNLSTTRKNQLRIARKGLFSVLAVSSMLGELVTVYGDAGPEKHLLDICSKLLQNLSLEPANRTRFYIAELRGTVRMIEKKIGKEDPIDEDLSMLSLQSQRLQNRYSSPTKIKSQDGARVVVSKGGYKMLTTKGPALSRDAVARPKVEFDVDLPEDDRPETGTMSSKRSHRGTSKLGYHQLPSTQGLTDGLPGTHDGGAGDSFRVGNQALAGASFRASALQSGNDIGSPSRTSTKTRFTEFLQQMMPDEERLLQAAEEQAASGSDSEDEQMGARDVLRISLPSLPQLMRRPMNHLWRPTPDERQRHGRHRWNPRVLEYREVEEEEASKMKLGATARRLLTTRRPEEEAARLFTMSLDLTMPGGSDITLETATMKVDRKDTRGGKIPVTIMQQPKAPELPDDPDMDPTSLTMARNQFLNSTATLAAAKTDALPLKVALDPERPRTLISFDDRLRVAAIFDPHRGQKNPRLMMFEHAKGAKVYQSLFPSYRLPNGKMAYYYLRDGVQFDEEEIHLLPPPPKPSSFPSALQRHMPLASMMDMLAKPPGTGGSVQLLKPLPRVADVPDRHTLPVKNPDVLEPWAFGDLNEANLEFILIADRVEKKESSTTTEELETPRPKTPWRLPESIFKPRVRESDSKGFFDTHQVEDKAFEREWKRCMGKEKLVSALSRENKLNRGKDDATMLKELQRVLRKHYMLIWSMFSYYASIGADNIFTLSLNDFTSLLETCSIPDPQSEFCKKSDCDTVFIVANFVQDKKSAEAQLSNEHQMMRHEFIEALIRLALNKYGKGQATTDIAEALEMLFNENIVPKVHQYARHEPNSFRREKLYVEDVDTLLKKNKNLLQAIYSRFRLPPRGGGVRPKLLKFDHWMALCDSAGFIDETFAIGQTALCYTWSRMMVIDEVKDYAKFESMTFIDFLEALARVADQRELPSPDDLSAWGFSNILEWKLARDSSGAGAYKPSEASYSRPLHLKLESLLDLMYRRLAYNSGDATTITDFSLEALLKKIKRQDHDLGT